MWILYAFGAAFFAGITAILAKIGIKNTDSNLATAIRTVVILLFYIQTLFLFLCVCGYGFGDIWYEIGI